MRLSFAFLAVVTAALVKATYIRKWALEGCGASSSERCNRLPAGRCCDKGRVRGGSVRIDNLPSYIDAAVPYDGRQAGSGTSQAVENHCHSLRYRSIRFGYVNCLSADRLGTGLWIHCSQSFDERRCVIANSLSKRDLPEDAADEELLDPSQFDTDHPGYIDEYEASLPEISHHDAAGNLISEEEFDRIVELELAHEANGTLHLLYPDSYPPDYAEYMYDIPDNYTLAEFIEAKKLERLSLDNFAAGQEDASTGSVATDHAEARNTLFERAPSIDVAAYPNNDCRGERLGVATEAGVCHNTINGGGLAKVALPDNCEVYVYDATGCVENEDLVVGEGVRDGCYTSGNFNSFRVACS